MTDQPRQVIIHEATCPDAPDNLLVLTPPAVRNAYPNARAHSCISHATVRQNRAVVVEDDTPDPSVDPRDRG